MKKNHRCILFAIIALTIQSCNNIPSLSEAPVTKIEVGPGPEDMVLDTLSGEHRLIISCSARRDPHKPYGEMVAMNLGTGALKEMIRYDEPSDLRFHPHGIYLDGDKLYVISHEAEPDNHPILIYRMHGDSLEFKELIRTPLQISPNALVTGPEGEIYFVNDSGKRGSLAEKALKLRRASVVRIEKDSIGNWKSEYVALKLGYPAGINRMGSRLYVGDAILSRVHVYNISREGLAPIREIKNLKGNDNIRIQNNHLITPGHVKPIKFIKHAKDPEKLSPVEVYLINPKTGQHKSLYYTDGSQISAGSTALIYQNHLYICQVFDPFILKVELEN